MAISWTNSLRDDGFALVPAVFSLRQVAEIWSELACAFASDTTGSTLHSMDGSVFGARNLLRLWPGVAEAWKQRPLPLLLRETLGSGFGLVRVLYFDKPPEQSWALPWHKDLTIAVQSNRLASEQFRKPTTKAGVPHVEAPEWLLQQMLTVRIHLDEVTDENGPLQIVPGSHVGIKAAGRFPQATIRAQAGDVLLMRPLASHCSNKSIAGTVKRRRVLHLEFSGVRELPDGYVWHDYAS